MANHAQRNLLHAYLDDELDLVRSMELEDHLAECGDCAHEVASHRALRDVVGASGLRYTAPEEFRARLHNELRNDPQPQTNSVVIRRSVPWWSWAAVAACLLLAAAAFMLDRSSRRENALLQEVVGEHVRSLMASHITDVVSTDQHTVKPWFTGKLDFSPQVRDLSGDGYELIGGRLEYIDGRNAAAIIYQKRKHLINLFTWPSAEKDERPLTDTRQGFNVVYWRQGGMYYCAVSDLNRQELAEFAGTFER